MHILTEFTHEFTSNQRTRMVGRFFILSIYTGNHFVANDLFAEDFLMLIHFIVVLVKCFRSSWTLIQIILCFSTTVCLVCLCF
jgi:hypothetical protein